MTVELVRKYGADMRTALKAGRDLIDQYDGKEMPEDVSTQIDKHFEDAKHYRSLIEKVQQGNELDKFVNEVDQAKILPVVGADGKIAEKQGTDEEKAFKAFLHKGRTGLTPEERKHLKEFKAALNETTAGQGGYLTPNLYFNEIVAPLVNLSYLRQAGARVITFESDFLEVPQLTYTAAAVLTTEASAYDEKEPTFGAVTFAPYKFTRIAKASEEVVADSRFDLWGQILSPDFVQAFAAAENTYMTTGTGSSQPEGVMQNAPAGVTLTNGTGNVSTITSADSIISLYYALDYKYRPNAKWMANDTTWAIVRKLKDSNNRYLVFDNNAQVGGAPSESILGKPVAINNSMATPAASAHTILLGDFSYFWIGDRSTLAVQRLDELYAANGQVGFRALKRFDSHMMLTSAFTALVQAAS